MASARGASPTPVPDRTITMNTTGSFDVLAPELITDILGCLPIRALWTAARVSRQLYAAAWRAGLFIHRNLSWKLTRDFDAKLAAFKDVLDHVKRKDLRLSLTLRCIFTSADSQIAQPAADELFPVISAALPFLVQLSVRIPDYFRDQLVGALRFPAPRLLTFVLDLIEYDSPCAAPLPQDLFCGSAPQLHTVKLDAVTLPDAPISTLRSVSHASIRHRKSLAHVDIGHHFPSLTNLHLLFFEGENATIYDDDHGHGQTVLPDGFNFQALGLRALVIEDISSWGNTPLHHVIKRCVDLSRIPVVEVSGRKIRWDERLWTEDTAPLSLRFSLTQKYTSYIDMLRVIAVPAHLRWRRMYNVFPQDRFAPLPIRQLPGLSARLAYLRLEGMLLGNWLELYMPFPALRTLRVDMRALFGGYFTLALRDVASMLDMGSPAVPETVSRVSTPCPALELISLFALDAPARVACIDSHRAALLARALGQAQRPKEERAALALVGHEFVQPVEHTLLDQTVSEIRTHAFAGVGSREDYDGGLWEPALSVRS